jgi:hypothetical protein
MSVVHAVHSITIRLNSSPLSKCAHQPFTTYSCKTGNPQGSTTAGPQCVHSYLHRNTEGTKGLALNRSPQTCLARNGTSIATRAQRVEPHLSEFLYHSLTQCHLLFSFPMRHPPSKSGSLWMLIRSFCEWIVRSFQLPFTSIAQG